MNILIVNHYAVPPTEVGGTRHFALARELACRGHDVTIAASSFRHKTRRETILQNREKYRVEMIDGVRFLWVRTPPYLNNSPARLFNMMAFAWRLQWVMRQVTLPTVEVVIGSTPHLFGALSAERLARSKDVPFILEVRDLWPDTLVEMGHFSRWHPIVLLLEYVERMLYRRALRIVTLLPEAAKTINGKGGRIESIEWIPNGVDMSHFPEPICRKGSSLTLMYAGAHGQANGLDTILHAAARLKQTPSIQFRLVGDGPEKVRLQQQASELQLSNVRFDAPVPREQVPATLADADAYIMHLRSCSLFRHGISPNKLFEYMAAGRPVVFAVDSSNNPVAEAGCGLLIPPDDPDALADAAIRLQRAPEEARCELGKRGRAYVERHHSFDQLAKKLESVVRKAVLDKERLGK